MNHHPLMATIVTRDLNRREADVGHRVAIGHETSLWEICATVDGEDAYCPTTPAPMPHS